MPDPLLIGIDLGTTNGKVACYDLKGQLQADAFRSYPTQMPSPGCYQQNPQDWLDSLGQALQEVTARLGERAQDVSGLAVSNFGPGIVLSDQEGKPLAPCPTWQDVRALPYGQRLSKQVGLDWIGLGPPLTGFPARLSWMLEEAPDLAQSAARVSDIKGFLMHWLTGESATDPSSGPGAPAWWAPVFQHIGWPVEKLPTIFTATESPGGLRSELARQVGLKPGIPVFTGVNDGAAATLGSGAIHLGDSVITLATNGACRLILSRRLDSETILGQHLFSWPLVESLWICGGFTCSGAGSLQWLADLFGLRRDPDVYEALLKQAAQVPIGSRGVVFLPYLAGRGTPHSNPQQRGGFIHVGLEHSQAELARAVLEGIALAMREITLEFARLGLQVGPIRITGGGARSKLWRQIIADVLDRPVQRAGGDSTLGGALVAAVGLGFFSNFNAAIEAMVKEEDHHTPQAANVAAYQRVNEVFTQCRDALIRLPRYVNHDESDNQEAGSERR